jgi:transcriptional regulator with XRE-family HTH domain
MNKGKEVKDALKEEFVESKTRIRLSVGESVRICRELCGLSQKKLGDLTEMDQATISGIESDRITLGIDRIKRLALAMHIHPAVLAFPNWEEEQKEYEEQLAHA